MDGNSVAIACDHAGLELKESLKEELRAFGFTPLDLGTHSKDSVDYPDYAHALAQAIAEKKSARGILVCGSGIGMSIAANRHSHIRAALCRSGLEARLARQHNDANVLCLGARITGVEMAKDCVKEFLNTKFEGGRHEQRVKKI